MQFTLRLSKYLERHQKTSRKTSRGLHSALPLDAAAFARWQHFLANTVTDIVHIRLMPSSQPVNVVILFINTFRYTHLLQSP